MSGDRVPGIDVDEAARLLSGDAQMIDVRDDKEWAAGHAPHSVHVTMAELPDATTWMWHSRRLVVVSRSGRRASEAVRHLRTAGLDAVRLEGGMHAWESAGQPLVSDTGRPAHIV